MKLHTYTLRYLSLALLLILSVWAFIFYLNMMDEVHDSVDDGLENYAALITQNLSKDSSFIHQPHGSESTYILTPISNQIPHKHHKHFKDTLLYMADEDEYEPFRMLTTTIQLNNSNYQLTVFSSMLEEDDLMEDLLIALVVLYLTILTSVFIINGFLIRKIWKPFYQLLDNLNLFKPGEPDTSKPVQTRIDEFNSLNGAINRLKKRVNNSYEQQKQLIENASHELQTPLAISINRLELLAENNSLNENESLEIDRVLNTLYRLTRLNKALLLLSKIENTQFASSESLNINDMVDRIIHQFQDMAAFKQVTVELQTTHQLTIKANADLIEILLSNLIKNAIIHNHPEGKIIVTIQSNCVGISNTSNYPALKEGDLFQRFQKPHSSGQGTGLGMAISKAIADLYQFSIRYHYDGLHNFKVIMSN